MSETRSARPPTVDELRLAIASIIGSPAESIAENANLTELGVDSLAIIRLLRLWRGSGIRVSARELSADPTIAAWRRYLHPQP